MGLVQAAMGIAIMVYLLVSILCSIPLLLAVHISLKFFNAPLALRINCMIQGSYLRNIVFMMETVLGLKLRVTGDGLVAEPALVVANHLTHDWAPMYCMALRMGTLGAVRTIIKKSMSYIPGFGWAMIVCKWPFVSRDYKRDQAVLSKLFQTYHKCKIPVQLWIYPEGTRQTPKKLKESQEYAEKNGYPVWKHVMLPRHRGFVQAINSLKGVISHVHEVTLSYSGWPTKQPSFWDLLTASGDSKEHIMHVHVNRVKTSTIPEDDEGMKEWLRGSFDRHEENISYFAKHGQFCGKVDNKPANLGELLLHVGIWVAYTSFCLSLVF